MKNNFEKNKSNQNKDHEYVGAPYNFVPLYKNVFKRYKSIEDIPAHNKIYTDNNGEDIYSGEINYTFENQTKMFVSDGKNKEEVDFYKNLDEKYAVPGSTMRGLIRTNMTILGFGAVGDDIYKRRFMYRKVGESGTPLSKEYKTLLGIKSDGKKTRIENVSAGYIVKEGGKWKIYGTVTADTNTDSNFFAVREDYVLNPDNIENFADIKKYLMYEKYNFVKINKKNPKDKRTENRSTNQSYKPYCKKIYYTRKGNKIIGISNTKNSSETVQEKGWVISTGRINKQKKAFYVIPDIDRENVIDVDEAVITDFKDDFKAKSTQLGENIKSFFNLPEDGNIKPVFYAKGSDGKLNLSFTPMLRVFYEKTVHDGIPEAHRNAEICDYVNAVFGFTGKNSFKSRVYFDDAVITTQNVKTLDREDYMLSSPKPSSYLDYLKYSQNKKGEIYGKSYNDDFEIRGIKQYWLREKALGATDMKRVGKEKYIKQKVAAKLKPIDKENVFKGKIRFKNLTKDELGLLLWSVCLEEGCCMNLGMAKPFGFGRIKMTDISLKLYDFDKMYNSFSLNFDVYSKNSDDEYMNYVEYYKNYIKENFLKNAYGEDRTVYDVNSIKTFLDMKRVYPKTGSIRYMDIDNREYQNRKKPLDTAEDIIKRNKKQG